MTIRVTFKNSGGELDYKIVDDPIAAADAAIEMIKSAGELYHGDSITIIDLED